MSDEKENNVQPIRAAVEGAKQVTVAPKSKKDAKKPKKDKSADDVLRTTLDDDCPVVPLGIHDDVYYYIDSSRQLRPLSARDHSRLNLMALFSMRTDYLWTTWPRKNEDGAVVGWKPEIVAEALMGSAARQGILDIVDRVRGPGAWTDEDGKLVFHCGDVLYHDGGLLEPGQVGRHIYPSAPEKPRPSEARSDIQAGETLLELLKSWNWRRGKEHDYADAHLLLGWIGASMIGGALKWRPMVWMTGDKATGKSTLHEVLKAVHGPGGLIHATDPTAAGLWQSVGHASLPIALDELESEADNRKNQNIIKLARHAASGGTTLRGGSDHKGTSFTARSCFLFSSILIPPLLGQDVSRMAILQLDKLEGVSAPSLKPKELAEIGAIFRKRLMEQWPRFNDTLEMYRECLHKTGHGGRSSDQFGTLLACADLLLCTGLPDEKTLTRWGEVLKRSTLAEAEDDIADSDRCLSHLLSSLCDVHRDGKRRTIGSWIEQAAGKFSGSDELDANKILSTFGLRVDRREGKAFLLVANTHQGMTGIFRETIWAGMPGSTGVWVQSLRRVSGAEASKTSTNFGGAPARFTRLPLDKIFKDDAEDTAA